MMPIFILPPAMQQLAESIRGKSMHRQIQRVQMYFLRYSYFLLDNRKIILTPLELHAAGKGDCKAHAIAKYLLLLRAGVPMEAMRLVITRDAQRTPHMVLFVGDRILDLQAFVYTPVKCPYIPRNGFNHQTHGFCENGVEAWFGVGRREDVIWDFNYGTFDSKFWRLWHRIYFRNWRKFNKKLEAEKMQSDFAKSLQVSPFEQAVVEAGVEVDKRGVSPETEAELSQLVSQAGGQFSPALFGKMSARALAELKIFIKNNQSGLMKIGQQMGVKL